MENYRLFAEDPIEGIHRLILGCAIPAALQAFERDIVALNLTRADVEANVGPFAMGLAMDGFRALRGTNDEGQTKYELFHACVLAAILGVIDPKRQHSVYYPEDRSYDFIITAVLRAGAGHVKQFGSKKVLIKPMVYKFEFTEATSPNDIETVVRKKMDPKAHDYRGRILLVGISFLQGTVEFSSIIERLSTVPKGNFEAVYVLGQVSSDESANGLAYFLAELIRHKMVLPGGFELRLDWPRINDELLRALR